MSEEDELEREMHENEEEESFEREMYENEEEEALELIFNGSSKKIDEYPDDYEDLLDIFIQKFKEDSNKTFNFYYFIGKDRKIKIPKDVCISDFDFIPFKKIYVEEKSKEENEDIKKEKKRNQERRGEIILESGEIKEERNSKIEEKNKGENKEKSKKNINENEDHILRMNFL